MLNRLLASVGIGGATVDTILDSDQTEPGGTLSGRITIRGGSVEQTVERVTLQLLTRAAVEVNDRRSYKTQPFTEFQVSGSLSIGPGQSRDIPFRIDIPYDTPVTFQGTRHPVWLRTDLGIPMAVDPKDEDALTVAPTRAQALVVEAMLALGFRLAKVDVEHRRSWLGGSGFVQEFEFRPAGRGRLRYDEVEIVFTHAGHGVDLLLQVDRSARGLDGLLREMTGTDERWVRTSLSAGTLSGGVRAVADHIEDVLRRTG